MERTNLEEYYVGIDVGSVSLNCIVINPGKEVVLESPYKRHFGRSDVETKNLIEDLFNKFGKNRFRSIAFTGSHGKKLSQILGTFYEYETICQVLGALHIIPDARSIISMGGQNTALFQIHRHDSAWELNNFNSNGPCASGTGSFIDQQAERLATSLYVQHKDTSQGHIDNILTKFIQLGLSSKRPAAVACRCTVFTKSDMIHLQNRGEKLEDIIYGLHVGNARNYISTVVSNVEMEDPIVFIGGLSLNALQVKAFQTYYPNLIIPAYNTSAGALGVALKALQMKRQDSVGIDDFKTRDFCSNLSVPKAPKLILKKTRFPVIKEVRKKISINRAKAYLGIDIGSTTSKYALISESHELIHKCYVPTRGKPIEVTKNLLRNILDKVGDSVEIIGTATTGSGRYVVGDFLKVDLVIDEITAHAKGAVKIDPKVDTIFEIGGQDSKYIFISNANPLDFDMNKVCAAGTGSFLHELANKFGINIVGEFQDCALAADTPVKLTDRCTVFMESDIVSYYQKGAARNDLMAGLCYAIVHNYLNRVVGNRNIGQRVMFLGGPSLNKGVVAAFENVLDCALKVPLHREVLGAYGAAICVLEKKRLEGKNKSTFRGLQNAIEDRMQFKDKICRADPNCHNRCKLKIYKFDDHRTIWGGDCGRYELTQPCVHKKENFFRLRQRIWETHMAGVYEELQEKALKEIDGRPTVGMQRALYGHQTAIMWGHFFDRLGFRLVLTPSTNPIISKKGIEKTVDGACYPVKVSHGHIEELAGKTRYLFIPSLITMPTPKTSEIGYYCPMVQSNSYMVRSALALERTSVLNPVIHLKFEPEILAKEIFAQIGKRLGLTRGLVMQALTYALEKQQQFILDMYQRGRTILEKHNPNEAMIVVTGRPYNLYDEKLNLKLGQNLAQIGLMAIPMDFIDVGSVELSDFPSMYWGLGAQILRTAKMVKENPNYFGLHLTNFGCGADSFLEHFYKFIMRDKAYLILELDEHSATAGVMTRLEAYKNVIANSMQKLSPPMEFN
jgi:predicted CoA-substrate-specific enzyme activase